MIQLSKKRGKRYFNALAGFWTNNIFIYDLIPFDFANMEYR